MLYIVRLRHRPTFKWCCQWILDDEDAKKCKIQRSYALGPQKHPFVHSRAPAWHEKDAVLFPLLRTVCASVFPSFLIACLTPLFDWSRRSGSSVLTLLHIFFCTHSCFWLKRSNVRGTAEQHFRQCRWSPAEIRSHLPLVSRGRMGGEGARIGLFPR